LNWVDVLNEQAGWNERADLVAWISEMAGRPLHLLDGTIDGFEEALGYMRRSLEGLPEGDVDLLWLDTQLKTVTLGLLHHQGAQEGEESRLPRMRARVKGMHDTDLLRAVKDTLLVQFAEYVGEVIDAPDSANVFHCEVCGLLFIGQLDKARYCSDACRFTEAQNAPEVLPTKARRRRYRNNA
jgi:hypothetical protein